MRSRTFALALAAAALAGSVMVNAPTALAAGNVEHAYSAPEISDEGDHVTWQWTLTNTGDQSAHKVVITHKITPNLPGVPG